MDHSEVLNLSITYLNDLVTIFRCCLASKHQNAACRAHVQQHLPSLLKSAHQDIFRHYSYGGIVRIEEKVHVKPLEWLYRTAGRTVVSLPATASALLCLSQGFSNIPTGLSSILTSVAIQHGVQLTLETLVAACKARVDFSIWLPRFFPHAWHRGTAWQLPDTLALPERVAAVCYGNMEVLERLLPQVTREQMPDMLQVAANRSIHDVMALESLLEHDKLHTQLLHAVSNRSSTAGSEVDDSASMLVQQLLVSSIVQGKQPDEAVSMLTATPAAQTLDAATVLKLLYLEVQYSDADEFAPHEDLKGSALAALCSLPAVRQLSAAQVGNLMHYAMVTRHFRGFGALLALPQAQQLPPKQLFNMLLDSASHAAEEQASYGFVSQTAPRALLCELAELDSAKQLAPGDAFILLEAALWEPWTPEMSMFEVLQDLDAMDLGRQLTGSELLQLMMMAAKDGSSDCFDLSELMPAASLIDDEAGYIAFLEKAMDADCTGDVVDSTATMIDLTMRLRPDSVLRLLQKCVSSGFAVCEFILLIPALQQIPTDAAGQLLLQAAKEGMVHQMQKVLRLPAVAELSAALLEELLQVILAQGSEPGDGCINKDIFAVPMLLKLPAARQLTAEAVAQAFLQVIGWRAARQPLQRDNICRARIHEQLASTAGVMQELVNLMDAVGLPESALVQLLQAAVAADDLMSLDWLCRASAAEQLSDASVQSVYMSALEAVEAGKRDLLQKLQEWVPQIAVAARTAELIGARMQRQIASALQPLGHQQRPQQQQQQLQQMQAAIKLCQHPDAAHISPADMQQLLQTALRLSMCSTAPADTSNIQLSDVASAMVSMQAAQALGSSAVAELMGYCLEQLYAAGVQMLSKLPATAQLNQQQSESLLQQALDAIIDSSNSAGSWKALEGLVQLRVIPLLSPSALQTMPAQAIMPQLLSIVKDGVQLPTPRLLVHQLLAALALSTDDVRMLLLAAVEAQDAGTFSLLRSLPAAPDDGEVQVWAVVVGLVSA